MSATRRSDQNGADHCVIVRESTIHGHGAYARVDILKGARFIEYVGPRLTKAQSLCELKAGNEYIFTVNDTWDIDGSVEWNRARFINHSCSPNCEAELGEDDGRGWIYALRHIRAGEELTYNYGYDLEDWQDHPCECGAPDCLGFIVAEELIPEIRRRIRIRQQATQGIAVER